MRKGAGTRSASSEAGDEADASPHWTVSAWLIMLEGRAGFELLATMLSGPLLMSAPRGDGHTVLLIPGFMQDASSMFALRTYLDLLGYDTHVWDAAGSAVSPDTVSEFAERVEALSGSRASPVSLIGWSFGGLIARAVAVRRPHCIRLVITLSAPFAG